MTTDVCGGGGGWRSKMVSVLVIFGFLTYSRTQCKEILSRVFVRTNFLTGVFELAILSSMAAQN